MGQHLGREDNKQDTTTEMQHHKVKDFQQELLVKQTRQKEAELENTAAAREIAKKEGCLDTCVLIFRNTCPDFLSLAVDNCQESFPTTENYKDLVQCLDIEH